MTAEERHKLLSPEEKRIYWRHQKEKKLYKELVPHYYNAKYGKDAVDAPKVELRSEKVRNIIGQVPPVLLRYGIAIIGLALLALVGVSAFIPYQPGIDTEISVTQDENGLLHFSTLIPQDVIRKIHTRRADSNRKAQNSEFSEVISDTAPKLSLPTRYQLENISDTVTLSGEKAWYSATLIPTDDITNNIQLEGKVVVPGKILLEKRSVLMWVVGRIARK